MGAKDVIFVDGELSSQIDELARYIGELKGASDVAAFAAEVSSGEVPSNIIQASLGGVLAKAPENKLEAVYNQLFAIAASQGGDDGLSSVAGEVARDIETQAESGVAGLRVLNNLYNLAGEGRAQAKVFESMVGLAARTQLLGTLVPLVTRLPTMCSEWGVSAEDSARIILSLRDALDQAQLSCEAYEAEVAFLQAVGSASDKAVAVASSAIVRFANLAALCDLDALASLASVQELSQRNNALGDAGLLLNALLSSDYRQWLQFVAANGGQLKALGVDAQKASDKMRLLTVASIAADSLGQGVPFATIAQAIDVAETDVEVWIIDVIRSGLIQGKMNQVARTLLPTRSTYRTFGADQWKLLAERLEQWKASLEELQPVISNAKLIAQQQAVQMAGTSSVTITE
ncbi:hypothetical protein GGI03_001812 [Coemansia sp. RSA 2337]|nr:hypothetical protein H4S03_000014 [Coemansia sp. S3946]KAJ2054104.1 hypothetical protein H4S04_000243 [Coemansia sp. S16]KAJ2055503.1 hypothetical protein GGI08_004114 [Coemansia sp. S2]KAJ2076098.1 hypothetical protein GGH13_000140 [Coemansia sp. S155-1]KAJ2111674.1 hypothetical protein IW146_005186 [Coemansia sp. RSA 922]KAJ2349450.1 hypothetical protein GGH92_002529 [Coemansia sp. RSA 2673]KAJ2466987.1 hypothetical protein GGI03_001812 [Coemansia sp. RSA 2337]